MVATNTCPVSHPQDVDLLDVEMFAADRDGEAFRRLRDESPLFWNPGPGEGEGFWSLTRYADVEAVAKDAARFGNADGTQIPSRRAEGDGPRQIHNMDAPDHGPMRRLLTTTFSPRAVEKLAGRVEEVTTALLDEALDLGEFDFVKVIASRLPLLVFAPMLGVPVEDADLLLRWTNESSSEDPEYSAGPETAAKARAELFAYFGELTAQRRACPRDDIVSTLVQSEFRGAPITQDWLNPYYMVLTVAGNETTRNLLTGSVDTLTRYDLWPRLRAGDDALRRSAVEEMVRWTSPVVHMRRTALSDVELHGTTVRTGEKVVLWFGAANRDERVFDAPDEFRLDRTPNRHLGFGVGPHFCLGAHLARMETRVFYEQVLARGIDIEVLGEPDRLRSNWFRGIKRLPVRVKQGRVA
ncbi:linalool 8-monooxygenase [Pseudonocardia sulfidoxydans NBRC 16205]|uniref:Linalool 8-monooxygenase n=1 Tax=Pseudonocardia sulfidoxydans NBRC 16205 TaxID=1223511 RepID=A0A511DM33_9PSEU|nr:cytochrome P450 [Pseudonocardia sulfidoxydans]GEL25871.1 linalool 8-monooxygenase [Pseudonocardia sulfidoxydans NBRC 16205]